MRKILLVAMVATAAMSSAAWADGNPAIEPATRTAAANAAVASLLLPVLDPLAFTSQPGSGNDPFNPSGTALHHRFASAMMDYYPVEGSGFHASFGARFYKKQYIQRDQQISTNGLLYVPRLPRGGGGGVRGFRRATPAATVGYTEMLRSNFVIGVEAGAMLGRAIDSRPDGRGLNGLRGVERRDSAMRTNPVVNVTFAYAF